MNLRKARKIIKQLDFPQPFSPDDWASSYNATCYNYVLGLNVDEVLMIGTLLGNELTSRNSTIEEQIEGFLIEVEALGLIAEEIDIGGFEYYLEPERGTYKIFITWEFGNKYHFLRQDENGIWSHKKRGNFPDCVDWMTDEYIFDPAFIYRRNRKNKCYLIYKR